MDEYEYESRPDSCTEYNTQSNDTETAKPLYRSNYSPCKVPRTTFVFQTH